jgi:hypothetical protein
MLHIRELVATGGKSVSEAFVIVNWKIANDKKEAYDTWYDQMMSFQRGAGAVCGVCCVRTVRNRDAWFQDACCVTTSHNSPTATRITRASASTIPSPTASTRISFSPNGIPAEQLRSRIDSQSPREDPGL